MKQINKSKKNKKERSLNYSKSDPDNYKERIFKDMLFK